MFDIKSIPKDLKNMLINVWLLPLWYVSIYIFSPTIYKEQDIILTVSICIGLTSISSMISIIVSKTLISDDEKVGLFDYSIVALCFTLQLVWLSLLIFFSYLYSIYVGEIFRMYGFLLTYFLVLVAFFTVISIFEKSNQDTNNT